MDPGLVVKRHGLKRSAAIVMKKVGTRSFARHWSRPSADKFWFQSEKLFETAWKALENLPNFPPRNSKDVLDVFKAREKAGASDLKATPTPPWTGFYPKTSKTPKRPSKSSINFFSFPPRRKVIK